MAKKKHDDATVSINGNIALPEDLRPIQQDIRITGAKIKDDFCTYDYRYLTGVEKDIPLGAKKGVYIIKEDMKKAFAKFNVHMAIVDDLFKNAGIEVADCDKLHGHEFTFLMECHEFKILGDVDSESVQLFGTKWVSTQNSHIPFQTPKIPLDSLSSYKWYNELKAAVDVARVEVHLFKEGKYTIPEDKIDDDPDDEKQTTMQFDKADGEEPGSDDPFGEDFGEAAR